MSKCPPFARQDGRASPHQSSRLRLSTIMPKSSAASSGDKVATPLEARLKAAEKDVAIALDLDDYEELIAVASNALNEKSRSANKNVIKSRKNLLWARSHAYNHKSLHALALKDAKAVLKIDPDDIAAYIRTAALLKDAGHVEQARGSLDKAASLAEKLDNLAKASWLRRLDKHRKKIFGTSRRLFDSLPNEILVEVALHLHAAGRTDMSQTCRSWRQILTSAPHLWTSLTVKDRTPRPSETRATEWLNHISMRAERANHDLQHVFLSGFLAQERIDKLIPILLKSAASLTYIDIRTRDHERCYELLYQFCPRLRVLALHEQGHDALVLPRVSSEKLRRQGSVDEAPESPMLFKLEALSVEPPVDHIFLLPHLDEVRVLINCNPFKAYLRTDQSTAELMQMLQGAAEHLEEWKDESYRIRTRSERVSEPLTLTFPRLVTATRYQVNSLFRFTFPQIEELGIAGDGNGENGAELAQIIETSTMLRRLTFLDRHDFGDFDSHFEESRELRHLEFLDVRRQPFDFRPLLPTKVNLDGVDEINFPFPKLRELIFCAASIQPHRIAYLLMIREEIRTGAIPEVAFGTASDRLSGVPVRTPEQVLQAFQRGSKKSSKKLPKVNEGLVLKNAEGCCPLQKITLIGLLMPITERIERLIRSVVPEVVVEYSGL